MKDKENKNKKDYTDVVYNHKRFQWIISVNALVLARIIAVFSVFWLFENYI